MSPGLAFFVVNTQLHYTDTPLQSSDSGVQKALAFQHNQNYCPAETPLWPTASRSNRNLQNSNLQRTNPGVSGHRIAACHGRLLPSDCCRNSNPGPCCRLFRSVRQMATKGYHRTRGNTGVRTGTFRRSGAGNQPARAARHLSRRSRKILADARHWRRH